MTLAGLQRLHRTGNAVAAIGQGVSPLAAGVHGDRTVGAGGRAIDAPGRRGIVIDVGRAELASHAEGGVFLHGANIIAGGETEHRCVVAAGDGDGHQLGIHATEAVADLHREHLVVTLAGLQRLHRTGNAVAAVGQGVGPLAAGVDGDRTVGAGGRAIDAPGRRGVVIDVGRAELAADAEGGVLLHGTGIVAGGKTEHRCVIAASDGDGHQLGVDAAEAVADLHRKHLVVTLAGLQRLHGTGNAIGAVGQGVSPLTAVVYGDRTVDAGI